MAVSTNVPVHTVTLHIPIDSFLLQEQRPGNFSTARQGNEVRKFESHTERFHVQQDLSVVCDISFCTNPFDGSFCSVCIMSAHYVCISLDAMQHENGT